MPVYLSLMCWRPTVIRPPSVSDRAVKIISGLHLESVVSEEKGGTSDSASSPSTDDLMEEENEPKQTKHNGEEGKASAKSVVTAEIGIQNKAITIDDEKEFETETAAEDDKRKDATDKEPDLNKENVEDRVELAPTPDKTATPKNEEVTIAAPDNKPEEPVPGGNSSEDTARASEGTNASMDRDSVANENNEQDSTKIPFGEVPQVALVSITQL